MIKYLSGRVKRTPQDRLSADRYDYLDVKQAEPNLADPATSPPVPSGAQFQLVAVPGYPGKRYWVPVGGGLIPGAISIFDEGSLVSSASSITQLNFVGAAVTAQVSVQSPSGFPGIAATITVNPVTILDTPPVDPRPGELWWESDTGDLYVYYTDTDGSQWVTTNTGGRGDPGTDGDKGQKGEVGAQGLSGSEGDKGQKGEKGEVGQKGEKGDVEAQGNKGQKGEVGEKGEKGQKGQEGLVGSHGDKAGLRYQYSHNTGMGDPGGGIFRYNNSSTLGSISAIAIDATTKEGTDVSDYIATWDDASNDTIKGHIIVKSNANDDATYTIFEVTAVTDNTGWLQITVQNPVGNFPSNNEECVINFTRVGNKGDKGQKGEVGEKGVKGEVGEKGVKGEKGEKGQKGEVGEQGIKGDQGIKGEVGEKGQKGEVGEKGQKGEGVKGQKGQDNSTKGQKGEPGEKGDTGDEGQKGEIGVGQKGETGADNSTKGQKGEVGSTTKGDKGNTGADNSTKGQKGATGADNSTKGQKGATGADNSTKGQKGATGADNSTKGQKGDAGSTTYSVPSGGIIIWSGSTGSIPSGWVLCNGSNSTPDLRDRFIVGAGSGYSVGNTGGYTDTPIINHNHTYGTSTSADGGHQHTENAYRPYYDSEDSETGWSISTEWSVAQNNKNIGNSIGNHAHNFNGTTNSASNSINSGTNRNLPPYYALCYIMKT